VTLWWMPFPPPWNCVSVFAWTKRAGERFNTGLQLSLAAFSKQEPVQAAWCCCPRQLGCFPALTPAGFQHAASAVCCGICTCSRLLFLNVAAMPAASPVSRSRAGRGLESQLGVPCPSGGSGHGDASMEARCCRTGQGCFSRGCSGHQVFPRGFGVNVLKMPYTSPRPHISVHDKPGQGLGQGWGRRTEGVSRAELMPGVGMGK